MLSHGRGYPGRFFIVSGAYGNDCVGMTQIIQTNMIISRRTDQCFEIFVYRARFVMIYSRGIKDIGDFSREWAID